ncbi:hypothetical protein PFISCL1PPCAC_1981, partial [Pristionchus fissidentatus]
LSVLRMESARNRLLDCISILSRQLVMAPTQRCLLNEISSTLQAVSPATLEVTLPSISIPRLNGSPLFFIPIAESPSMHCSIFGFRNAGDVIPMHDHPLMHGFIRVLRGSLRVTSFSTLSNAHHPHSVRFNGVREVSARDGCIYLSPDRDNIHQVSALEDGTFFFDLLIPGYKEVSCSYFELPHPLPAEGSEIQLRRCSTPDSYSCITLPYDTLHYEE